MSCLDATCHVTPCHVHTLASIPDTALFSCCVVFVLCLVLLHCRVFLVLAVSILLSEAETVCSYCDLTLLIRYYIGLCVAHHVSTLFSSALFRNQNLSLNSSNLTPKRECGRKGVKGARKTLILGFLRGCFLVWGPAVGRETGCRPGTLTEFWLVWFS